MNVPITCHLCKDDVGTGWDVLLFHLRLFHPDYYALIERWPDVEFVLHDPEDLTWY